MMRSQEFVLCQVEKRMMLLHLFFIPFILLAFFRILCKLNNVANLVWTFFKYSVKGGFPSNFSYYLKTWSSGLWRRRRQRLTAVGDSYVTRAGRSKIGSNVKNLLDRLMVGITFSSINSYIFQIFLLQA